jgi:hypothetical protein
MPSPDGRCALREEAWMSKRLLGVAIAAIGVTALTGCIVVPAHPGYGYYGHRHGYYRVVPPPPVYGPRQHYGDHDYDDGWRRGRR